MSVIADSQSLEAFLEHLPGHSRIALDTEADSLHCYFEKLCLIQVSVPGRDVLIDPLAGFPLDPFFQALAGRELILHGADYDLRLLQRAGFTQFHKVFDTMIAARLAGLLEFSLAALVSHHFGVELVKGSQKANWAQRPLSERMIDYAINDTRYLIEMAQLLESRLRELGRWEWFGQSCERAVQQAQTVRQRDLENAWRISGSSDLRGRAAAILRELWHWRDSEARTVDRPPFHIANNELLVEAARRADAGEKVAPAHLRDPRRRRFEAALERALALEEEHWPQPIKRNRVRATPEEEKRFRDFRERRDKAASQLSLDPSLIAPKATLEALAADPEGHAQRLLPWQRELLKL